MADFPFDGLDLDPTPAQAELVDQVRSLIARRGLLEPDVIQPRPTNPEAIEVFWVDAKLCVVIESVAQVDSMAALAPADAAWVQADDAMMRQCGAQ